MGKTPKETQISKFQHTTGCPDKAFAITHLKKHNCNITKAINEYLDNNLGAQFKANEEELITIFQSYKEADANIMGQTGIVTFFSDASVPLQDILPVIFSCEGGAKAMGQYSKDEFVKAMQNLNLSSVEDFKQNAKNIKQKYLEQPALFNKVYKYSFGYMAMGNKFVNRKVVAMMLGVLVADRYELAPMAIQFLNSEDVRKFQSLQLV